MISQDHYEPWF